MNDGREDEFPNERRILINSPKVATYDLQPEMSAYDVTDALLEELDKGDLNAVILNFANPDMVGHSGKLEPTIKAKIGRATCRERVKQTVERERLYKK